MPKLKQIFGHKIGYWIMKTLELFVHSEVKPVLFYTKYQFLHFAANVKTKYYITYTPTIGIHYYQRFFLRVSLYQIKFVHSEVKPCCSVLISSFCILQQILQSITPTIGKHYYQRFFLPFSLYKINGSRTPLKLKC